MCRIVELRNKEVINVCDGARLGFVYDLEIDACKGCVCSIVVPGPCRFLGLFGREEDYVIPWEKVKQVGDEIILVEYESRPPQKSRGRRGRF